MLLAGESTRRGHAGGIGLSDRLDRFRTTRSIALALLPVFVFVLWPAGFDPNEYTYFMQPFRRVAPDRFSEFSAIFDSSSGRIAWEYLIGYPIAWFGYDTAHVIARLLMAAGYAVSAAFLFNALKLTAFDGILVVGTFLIAGEDILGKEWLFQGVESKTVAYALVMAGLALAIRGRATMATIAAVIATYLHFLVGGFWFLALLAYDALRDFAPRRQLRLVLYYALLVSPLVAVVAYQQLGPLSAAVRDPSASYLYAIFRHPHHVAPFANAEQLLIWAPDIALTVTMAISFLLLSRSDLAKSRPVLPWVTGLLWYLVLALGLSALDWRTGSLGKFHLFRPSSLILFCAIAVIAGTVKDIGDRQDVAMRLRKAAFYVVVPLAVFVVMVAKIDESSAWRGDVTKDIARMNAFILDTTPADAVVLVEPGDEYHFPKVALPLLLGRPTLVSFKFVPTNDREIYRWYDLLQYRKAVFADGCRDIDRFPVRYLLMRQRPGLTPPCGRVVWRSDYFALVDPGTTRD